MNLATDTDTTSRCIIVFFPPDIYPTTNVNYRKHKLNDYWFTKSLLLFFLLKIQS